MYRSQKLAKHVRKTMKDSDIYPICIPSYNRPDAKLLQKLYEQGFKNVVLFVRKEQYDLYKIYEDKFKIVKLKNVFDLGSTRASIVNYCWSKGIDNIFLFDDDIYCIDYMYPGITSGGHECMRPRCTNKGSSYKINKTALKMWVYLIEHRKEEVALSAPGGKADWWNIRNANSPYVYNSGCCIQCIHINIRLLKENGINYKSNKEIGVEDYYLQFTCMSAGLNTIVFKDLVYCCPNVGAVKGGCKDSNNYNDELAESFKRLNQLFTDNVLGGNPHKGIGKKTTKSGWESLKFNWNYWRKKEEE